MKIVREHIDEAIMPVKSEPTSVKESSYGRWHSTINFSKHKHDDLFQEIIETFNLEPTENKFEGERLYYVKYPILKNEEGPCLKCIPELAIWRRNADELFFSTGIFNHIDSEIRKIIEKYNFVIKDDTYHEPIVGISSRGF